MKFFNNCNSINEVKATYKNLCKQFHPDLNRDTDTTAIMQEINKEYAFAIIKAGKGENLSTDQMEAEILNAEQYRQALEVLQKIVNINVELCGGWLWVSGDTYPVRTELKAAGFFWASAKKMWYFRSPEYATNNRQKHSMDEIRTKYGTQAIKTSFKKAIA